MSEYHLAFDQSAPSTYGQGAQQVCLFFGLVQFSPKADAEFQIL